METDHTENIDYKKIPSLESILPSFGDRFKFNLNLLSIDHKQVFSRLFADHSSRISVPIVSQTVV